ncbi:MAG TPA: bifunctional 2-C-methyl-D-erythritol 4-phosphate cytidylyltransferase/2-C-methyl-D-erythritol 2,4-cyclodiphosphate synthase, partial [Firmicutes bacterium]|nr:bifunctional 2-C-methyl-D-erythritol 4-phosphate cytidylyltransferase/2-C-methyl-D-erythritol 2,4-cyclodiphosphate synthase [Bacillota bacterium]
ARPFFSEKLIPAMLRLLKKEKAVIPVKKINKTVKMVDSGYIKNTVDRDVLRTAETPQGFDFRCMEKLYKKKNIDRIRPTDEAAVFESAGYKVRVIEDPDFNVKVTEREDLEEVERFMKKRKRG